jgi:MFS family permease
LVKKGRAEEAHQILATYHANGDLDDPLVLLEIREIQAAVDMEEKSNTGTWKSFVSTVGNRRRFFVIIMIGTATQWIGNGLVSYFLVPILKQVGITKPAQTAGINGGIAVWSWFVAMTGASLSDRYGRRALFLTALVGALISFIFITGLSGGFATTRQSTVGIAMIPFLFIFNAFYALAFTPIPMLYTPEISPFSLRAKSAALLLLSQNCAQAFNQFANPVALNAIAWKYFIVYVAVITVYLVLFYFFCRETKGLTVEEAAVVYEPDSYREEALEQERKLQQQGAFQEARIRKASHEEDKLEDDFEERKL